MSSIGVFDGGIYYMPVHFYDPIRNITSTLSIVVIYLPDISSSSALESVIKPTNSSRFTDNNNFVFSLSSLLHGKQKPETKHLIYCFGILFFLYLRPPFPLKCQ